MNHQENDNVLPHSLTENEILHRLSSHPQRGLSLQAVKQLQAKFGKNTLPEPKSRSLLNLFFSQFLSPLVYILLGAAAISTALGDSKDALVILVVVTLNALIGAIQEGRAEKSLSSLRKLSKLSARVIREGQEVAIEASELVPGDIFMVTAGDGVPTDGRLLESSSLRVSEAALTGESAPVEKRTRTLSSGTLLADRTNMIYAGTQVTGGRGLAIATSTGLNNELGQIAALTTEAEHPPTNLELKIEKFGNVILWGSGLLFFLTLAIGLAQGLPFRDLFIIAVSQMVSLVPEGLPVAVTIALAVGVQRMAKQKTIVRRLSAIEELGSTTVICSDKTGTLTRNEMTITEVYFPETDRFFQVSGTGYFASGEIAESGTGLKIFCLPTLDQELALKLFEVLICCNDATLESDQAIGDPTELALISLARKGGLDPGKTRTEWIREEEVPFDSDSKVMATLNVRGESRRACIKGAPEALFKLCNLDPKNRTVLEATVVAMARRGLRVLGAAIVESWPSQEKLSLSSDALKGQAKFLGLVGQMDPPRDDVETAVEACFAAGIRPIMITGDHKETGFAVAQQIGIAKAQDRVLDGSELQALSDMQLSEATKNTSVFSRVQPSQKLMIVKSLQKMGHIVAMTGDGVNDAPALAQANVGVAMGITGTEVAKEASKIIVTDDNFATIVRAVAEGRLVYKNIKKLILFLFVTSLDEVVILFSALLMGYPPPLAAVQILWINLVSETALTANLIMEPSEGDEMKLPPTSPAEPLLDRGLLKRIPLMVLASAASVLGWYIYRLESGAPVPLVQSETFTVLVVSQWFNALNCRSATQSAFSLSVLKNPWLIGGLAAANALHFLVIYWEPLAQFFHTVPIAPDHFLEIGLTASLVLWTEEVRKFFARRKKAAPQA